MSTMCTNADESGFTNSQLAKTALQFSQHWGLTPSGTTFVVFLVSSKVYGKLLTHRSIVVGTIRIGIHTEANRQAYLQAHCAWIAAT